MAENYTAIVQEILEKWLESLIDFQEDDTQIDPDIQGQIKALVNAGDIGKFNKIKAVFKG